ncbi:MAG TPA: hypothetical protein VL866_24555 [Pyrinomonadaceae bacterium]|nr:hypothetical protein [Pyrinomonadaceae bacterium]
MADDGNRQVVLSLSSATMNLSPEQFAALDTKLGGIDGAINKLAEGISAPDTSVAAEISLLRNEVGMRLTALNETIVQASENLGKWLAAIALAAANPDNNTDEVQQHIDEAASAVRTAREKLQTSVDNQTTGD